MNNLVTTQSNPAHYVELIDNDPHLPSVHTKRQYKSNLRAFDAWRGDNAITKILIEAYAAHLQQEGKAPATINQSLAAIRWYARKVLDWALDNGDEATAAKLARVAMVEDVTGDRPETGRMFGDSEIEYLIDACTKDKARNAGTRDAALFALAHFTGARREEISNLRFEHLDNFTEEGVDVTIEKGKGGKYRKVFVYNGAFAHLKDWLDLRGTEPGPLFKAIDKGDNIRDRGMSGEALRVLLYKRQYEAGIEKPITWHDFRRTFASNLWAAGVDGVIIQKLMGHASQNQTAKYDRRPEEARRNAVKVLHVPYKSRP